MNERNILLHLIHHHKTWPHPPRIANLPIFFVHPGEDAPTLQRAHSTRQTANDSIEVELDVVKAIRQYIIKNK